MDQSWEISTKPDCLIARVSDQMVNTLLNSKKKKKKKIVLVSKYN